MTVQKGQQRVIETANTKTLTCGTHFADRCGRKEGKKTKQNQDKQHKSRGKLLEGPELGQKRAVR